MGMISGTSRKPLFHYPDRLLVGNAPLVGVLDLPGTHQRPPVRLFFPADATSTASPAKLPKPASYFVDNRVAYVLQGFAHIVLARHTTKFHRLILRPLCWLLSLIFPVWLLKIPGTVHVKNKSDASKVHYMPPSSLAPTKNKEAKGVGNSNNLDESKQQQEQSLVVFSHGLTGTGEENSIFCTSLAKRGHVVASIHHRDGSSSRVPMPDGTCRYYEHLPTGDDYDPKHRLEQVHARAKEFLHTCSWLTGEGESDDGDDDIDDQKHQIVDQIRPHLNKNKIIAAGFSYGATTVSLAATLEPAKFQCAILLDPWLHIDYSSKGIEYDFPPEAYGNDWPVAQNKDSAVEDDDVASKKKGLDVPSLFINSAQFRGYKKLFGATQRLADRINAGSKDDSIKAEMHVIPGTKHQNFCDTVFWLPRRLAKKFFQLGDADAYEAYEDILNHTNQFLQRF